MAPAPPTAGALLMPQLRQLVERQLQEAAFSLPVGARIEIALPPGLVLPQKCLLPFVEAVPNRRPPGPMVPYVVRCAPSSAGVLGASVTISVRVAVIQRAVVAARTLSANVPIAMTDLSLADADISTIGTDAMLATGDVVGRVLSRSFSTGAVLLRSAVRNPVAIRTGDSVRLEIIGSGFIVSSESVALQNASTGDMIRVRNSEGQTVSGRLDSRGVVVIDMRRSE
jgi:flagella basal body P-ring formation protein FlgA